jgi:hypothetical protein
VVVGADIVNADIVAPDDEDVGLLAVFSMFFAIAVS